MKNPIRIVVVSHACVVPENRARWQRLAERHPDTEVIVLVPAYWEGHQYGVVERWRPQQLQRLLDVAQRALLDGAARTACLGRPACCMVSVAVD